LEESIIPPKRDLLNGPLQCFSALMQQRYRLENVVGWIGSNSNRGFRGGFCHRRSLVALGPWEVGWFVLSPPVRVFAPPTSSVDDTAADVLVSRKYRGRLLMLQWRQSLIINPKWSLMFQFNTPIIIMVKAVPRKKRGDISRKIGVPSS
jgi:hypothetical protein